MTNIMPAIPTGEREYIAAVLWVHGRTLGEIAKVVGWNRVRAKVFTNRLLQDGKARSHMEDTERAAVLDHFAADRHDGGRLRDEHFKPISLPKRPRDLSRSDVILAVEESWGECLLAAREITDPRERTMSTKDCHEAHRDKLREAGVEESNIPDPGSPRGRKEVREIERRFAMRRKKQQEDAGQRELGGAVRRGRPLEYLNKRRLLADGRATSTERHSEEMRRYEAGERLQRYIDGARIATLGALDMERASMGHGSTKAMTLSGYKLFCAQTLGAIRHMTGRLGYIEIESVVDQDQFRWERFPEKSRKRARALENTRRLLDIVAVHENLMSADAFADRWDEAIRPPDPRKEPPSRYAAAAQADAVADLVESAR